MDNERKTKADVKAAKLLQLQEARENRLKALHTAKVESAPEQESRSASSKIALLSKELKRKDEMLTDVHQLAIQYAKEKEKLEESIGQLQMSESALKLQVKSLEDALTRCTRLLEASRRRTSSSNKVLRYARRQLKRLEGRHASLKERSRVLGSQMVEKQQKLTGVEAEARKYQIELDSCRKSIANTHHQLCILRFFSTCSETRCQELEQQLGQAKKQIEKNDIKFQGNTTHLRTRLHKSQEKCRILQMSLSRAHKKSETLTNFKNEVLRIVEFTESNKYTPSLRALVRQIIAHGCPLTRCGAVMTDFIRFLCKSVGIFSVVQISKIRIPSVRSIRRMVREGDVASKILIGHHLGMSRGFTTGGDGTTNRGQNFDALHLNVQLPSGSSFTRKVLFGEVRLAANHKSETQMKGDVAFLEDSVKIFNESPLAKKEFTDCPLTLGTVAMKYRGSHGDHAEDQKAKHQLLATWKHEMTLRGLGTRFFFKMDENERNALVLNSTSKMIRALGGKSVWDAMSCEEQNEKNVTLMREIAESLVERALLELSDQEKRELLLFVWAGCGMHKDLNATKGGCLAMSDEWKKHGIAPVLLANRDNAAVIELGEMEDDEEDEDEQTRDQSAAEKRAREVSKAGGEKLGGLMGALVRHKDKKKGHQDNFRDWAQMRMLRNINFPDTSNTRYSSYLDAAAEMIAYLEEYLDFIRYVRYNKKNPVLNHLEQNVEKGLLDPPTLTELACMAFYREAVSIPYIGAVRGKSLVEVNALDLGSLLQKTREHIKKLIRDPQLVLAAHALPQEATMDGNESWNRPDTIRAIQRLITEQKLPKLEELFRAFLTGALSKWESFSSEFKEDGLIAALTEAERDMAWMPATNDANEGILGSLRKFSLRNPNASITLFNALFRYERNDTESFIESMLSGEDEQNFLMRQARKEDEEGRERKLRREIMDQKIREAAEKEEKSKLRRKKKEENAARLRGIELTLDHEAIEKMTVKQLKDQLAKFKKELNYDVPDDNKMRKAEKKALLLSLVDRYRAVLDAGRT